MYRVYCDGEKIYDPLIADKKIFDTQLDLELNKTGTFAFTIRPDNAQYGSLRKMRSLIDVYDDDDLVFRGRILDEEGGFYNEKNITCEGELAYLCDGVILPKGSKDNPYKVKPSVYLDTIIKEYNAQMGDEWKHFYVGNVSAALDEKVTEDTITDYKSPWEVLITNLVNAFGGYLWLRYEDGKKNIDYLVEPEVPSNQKIILGVNLLDLKKSTKGADFMTGIFPYAKGESSEDKITLSQGFILDEDTDEKTTLSGKYIVLKNASASYGRIIKPVAFECSTEAELESLAIEYVKKAAKFATSVELTAADISGIKKNVNPFRLGQRIGIVDNKHGLEELETDSDGLDFLVKKLSINILSPTNNKLSVGATFSTFTEKVNATASSQAKTAEKAAAELTSIKNSASNYLTRADLEDYNNLTYYTKAAADARFVTLSSYYSRISGLESRIKTLEDKINAMSNA